MAIVKCYAYIYTHICTVKYPSLLVKLVVRAEVQQCFNSTGSKRDRGLVQGPKMTTWHCWDLRLCVSDQLVSQKLVKRIPGVGRVITSTVKDLKHQFFLFVKYLLVTAYF